MKVKFYMAENTLGPLSRVKFLDNQWGYWCGSHKNFCQICSLWPHRGHTIHRFSLACEISL